MSDLLETFEDGVMTLTLNRPKARNALNEALMKSLNEAASAAAGDPKVRCLVLTGAGGVFCGGGDVKDQASDARRSEEKGDEGPSPETRIQTVRQSMEVCRQLHVMPKPTLAIIPGPVVGAGFSMALACDMRFCLDTAKITTGFSKMGLSGDCGGSYFLPQLVGAAKARELYFTSDVITGREAYEIGLVTKVAGIESFEEESQAYAKYLASLPTVAIGYMKKNLNAAQDATLCEVFDLEAEHVVRTMMTEDHKRAAIAFMNKEKVDFKGR